MKAELHFEGIEKPIFTEIKDTVELKSLVEYKDNIYEITEMKFDIKRCFTRIIYLKRRVQEKY